MFKNAAFLLMFFVLLIVNCKYSDFGKKVPSYLVKTSELALEAIDKTVKISDRKEVRRYVATYAATLLAEEAIKLFVMTESRKLDKIFGENRSEILLTLLLENYCYPIIRDIIKEQINYYFSLSDSGQAQIKKPDPDSIVRSYIIKYKFNDPYSVIISLNEQIEAITARKNMEIIKAVNADDYAACRNWKDGGKKYEYRIRDSILEMRVEENEWRHISIPYNKKPVNIASDNNRCFVMTAEKELWWYCPVEDQAKWSIDIMKTAVEIIELKSIVGEGVCGDVVALTEAVIDSVMSNTPAGKNFMEFIVKKDSLQNIREYFTKRCNMLTDAALSLDRILLKAGGGRSFTAKDYALWSKKAHATGSWSNLLYWETNGELFERGKNIDPDSIADIAVGNWNGTVVTMYVLAHGKIWFIDEEIIHPDWKPVEKWNNGWLTIKDYKDIGNSPYPLDNMCRIDASNSVIAVLKKDSTRSDIYFLRWDYHQKDDFVYWPLDWCEHEWYRIKLPVCNPTGMRINTLCKIDPRLKNTPWSVPAPAFAFHNYLPQEGYEGIFGDIPREKVSIYPVGISVKDTVDTIYFHYSEKAVDLKGAEELTWEKLPVSGK